jgi:hypothetical protein
MGNFLNLGEAARNLDVDVESLIRRAACGDLTVFVIAKNWAVRRDDDAEAKKLSERVYLVAEDLLQGVDADFTRVRQVRVPGSEAIVTLKKPRKILRGVHYVTGEEFDRFRRQNALTLKLGAVPPPYLDPNHEWHSPKLAAAVNAWMALFADGNFQKGHKGVIDQIESWLMSNTDELTSTARGYIAKVVNPKKTKVGGAPTTPSK